LALDLLGFGFSAKPQEPEAEPALTIRAQARLVEAVLARLKIQRVDSILAHDLGDSVVQELLALLQEGKAKVEVGGVCFLNGGVIPNFHRPTNGQKVLAHPTLGKGTEKQRYQTIEIPFAFN
jgi:pimeloyl-ACP methyl ester carboxylesterase